VKNRKVDIIFNSGRKVFSLIYYSHRFGKRVFHVVFFIALIHFSGLAQSINTEFGKNRVQYHDDFTTWWQYETQNFITYWYGKSRNVAVHTIQLAEQDHNEIQKLLEHKINDKIEIIVYLDISDLKQSNIGTEETFVNKTGETKIIGNKMFVYFDGDHQNLRLKIREGISRVYFNHMLFGSTFQEIIQNALLMNIPDWFKEGIVRYASENWNPLVEDELRDIWLSKPEMREFKKISKYYPAVAGHSFWFFIEQNYGRSSISNVLYLTKISRGIDNSFLYVFNEDQRQINDSWNKFFTQYFNNEKNLFSDSKELKLIHHKKKKYVPVSQLLFNAKGDKFVYVLNKKGKTRIYCKDLKNGKKTKIFSHGFVNGFQETDYNYPVISWHPKKDEIAFCYEHKDVIKLRIYSLDEKKYVEQVIPEAIQRIYSLSQVSDNEFVFSAAVNGFSDLITYQFKTRSFQNITKDNYDDLDATTCTLNGKKGVLFASNRPVYKEEGYQTDTILPVENYKIFFLNTENSTEKEYELLTEESGINLRYPFVSGSHSIMYLSSISGINNIQKFDLKTKTKKHVTNLDRNAIRYHVSSTKQKLLTTYYHDGQYKIFEIQIDSSSGNKIDYTPLQKSNSMIADTAEELNEIVKTVSQINNNYLFQSSFSDQEILTDIKDVSTTFESNDTKYMFYKLRKENTFKEWHIFNPSRITPANKKFSLQKITTKFDNDILFEGLETYTGDRQQLLTTPMGFLLKANIKDLFEDFSIDIGARFPLLLNGSEFFLVFDNKKSMIDKRMALYRKTLSYTNNENGPPTSIAPSRSNKTTTLGLYQWKIPFNIYKSIRLTSQLRFDKFIQKSTDNSSFESPSETEQRISLRAEYIYDNSYEESVNIKFGTRYKIYVEAINTFNVRLLDGFEFDLSKGFTSILGFDARHYIPVFNKSVLALRSAAAVSMGSDRMLYYIGGMENWLFPGFNDLIPQRTDIDFSYKANIGQMRGFDNNIRNGTAYFIVNTELRIPFMQYLLGKRKVSSFLKNLQITGFFDSGMAWYGLSPFSKENPLNKVIIQSPPVITLEVEYFKDPLVFGLGYGLRSQILGYYFKFDYAWGIETGKLQKPVYYITIGQDF
jgi:hypothetical protein